MITAAGVWRTVALVLFSRKGPCGPFQLLLDCSELEVRLTETLSLVNTDDYGKDQLATQRLINKHQVH